MSALPIVSIQENSTSAQKKTNKQIKQLADQVFYGVLHRLNCNILILKPFSNSLCCYSMELTDQTEKKFKQ